MLATVALYFAFGALAGLLSGMFGVGGGIVIVPFLANRLDVDGFPAESIMVVAIATSLATIIITSLSSIWAHHRRGAVQWPMVKFLTPGILAGSLLGAVVADGLPVSTLKIVFGTFLLIVASRMLLSRSGPSRKLWHFQRYGHSLAGLIIGTISAILGIGGGTISVPYLVKCNVPMKNAVAVSSACGLPIAISSVIGYIALGWRQPELPPWSIGYVYLPAFAGIVVTSTLCAPVGAALAHRLPTFRLKKLFAAVLFVIGGKMLWPWLVGIAEFANL